MMTKAQRKAQVMELLLVLGLEQVRSQHMYDLPVCYHSQHYTNILAHNHSCTHCCHCQTCSRYHLHFDSNCGCYHHKDEESELEWG